MYLPAINIYAGRPGLQVRIEDEITGERSWHSVHVSAKKTTTTATDEAEKGEAEKGEDQEAVLVVNTGRMIERWTGGFFKAAVS
jgi:isopenicillin N synthase-like dioxygenase